MDNKRVILAVVLSMAVLVGWNFLFPPHPPQQAPQQQSQPADAEQASAQQHTSRADTDFGGNVTADIESAETAPFRIAEEETVTVSTPLYEMDFNTAGGFMTHLRLKEYKESIEPNSPLMDLMHPKAMSKAPMGLLYDGRATWKKGAWTAEKHNLDLSQGDTGRLKLTLERDGGRIVRILQFTADSYEVKETVTVENISASDAEVRVGLTMATTSLSSPGNQYDRTRVAWFNDNGLSDEDSESDLKEGRIVQDGLQWGGVESNYFLLAIAPMDPALLKMKMEDEVYRLAVEMDSAVLAPGGQKSWSAVYFMGPKESKVLENAPNNLYASFNLGWFEFIAKPLLDGLNFFYSYTGNYGWAIIILTLIIKIVFIPLSHKSYKSMEQMKKLQPMMAKIREKYKDDRQKMNEEMMQLYKTYKVNPAGGCLPMLLQIPVFLGLYNALLNSIELRHAPFIAHVPFTDIIWLADLSAKDPFYVTPVIMGATMFLQQKMTPSPGDPTQAKIMLLMPVFFTFIFLNFPSGLVVYWLVNNVLSIAQQWWMLRSSNKAEA